MTSVDHQLERDLRWREEELASLKHQIVIQTNGTVAERSLLRAIWAMLYAHYEGFCRFALNVYLDHVKATGIVRSKCRDKLTLFSLRGTFKSFRSDLSDQRCYDFFQHELATILNEAVDFERDQRTQEYKLAGESNLSPELLKENCDNLCLNVPSVASHHTRLWQLVDRRNKIAHGKSEVIRDLDQYQVFENAAIEVMYELCLVISDAVTNNHFEDGPTP